MNKNDRLLLRCERLGSELEGICSYEGRIVFVPGMLPGEEGEVQLVKVQPRFAFGKLIAARTLSPERREAFCPLYGKCGGCDGQHMRYEATLQAKREQVLDCLTRIGALPLKEADVPPVIGMEEPYHYRNKAALPIGGTAKAPMLGFYRKRSHDIVALSACPVAMGHLEGVEKALRKWIIASGAAPYNELSGHGLLRHAVYRVNRQGEGMLTLCAARDRLPNQPLLISLLKEEVPGFCALHLSVNSEKNNVILGKSSRCLYGKEALEESLLGLRFEIPPLSFFQVNPLQTERLYRTAIDFACLTPNDTVVDAYAGAGTISLCMASHCKKVVAIEIVPQAVEGGRKNAEINGISNVEFHTSAVEELLPKLVKDGLRPDTVILDPPRKGCEKEVLEAVIASGARRVVYVSCHVPTQARDAKLLQEGGYRFERCQSVDMFCWTGGVENVLSMVKSGQTGE